MTGLAALLARLFALEGLPGKAPDADPLIDPELDPWPMPDGFDEGAGIG